MVVWGVLAKHIVAGLLFSNMHIYIYPLQYHSTLSFTLLAIVPSGGFGQKRVSDWILMSCQHIGLLQEELKPGISSCSMTNPLRIDDDDDELMLNVLRCHLTY